jgi:DNA repair protein RecO (recombination protein O)
MEWSDTGLVLGIRKHGESSVIVEAMTRDHGRHLGLVRGGRSRRNQPVLQIGNTLDLTWRARLEDHLGQFTIEAKSLRAAEIMADRASLHLLQTLVSHLRLLAEREPNSQLYEAAELILGHLDDPTIATAMLVKFELRLLEELGFGLDLSACAATGDNDALIYVSPKSGKAVSASAGEPYHDRLLALPGFLVVQQHMPITGIEQIAEGLALTRYFMDRDVYGPRAVSAPHEREALLKHLQMTDQAG